MKLYYTVISAFSRKCRILARELNIIQDIQEIITTMRSADSVIMSINPTGKVPALITNQKQLITESYAICNYLEKIANSNINSDNNYDTRTRFNLSGGIPNNRYFKRTVKHYLFDQVRTSFLNIPANEMAIAIFLPVARFQKGQPY